MFNNFFPENRAVYEIMWKNMVEPDRQQMEYGACALLAASLRLQTHTEECVIAFPRQKWLRECALVLRYTHIACLVLN